MKQKLIALFLIVVLLISLAAPAMAAPSVSLRSNAVDIRYANGMMGGLFYPDDDIVRFSVAEMLYYLIETKNIAPNTEFKDLDGAYGELALATLAGADILRGFPDHTIRPSSTLTRAEFATILCRLLGLSGTASASFSDAKGHWGESDISLAAQEGLLLGYPDGTFRPDGTLTRAECVVVINRMIGKEDTPDRESYFSDLKQEHWAYGAVMAAASGTNCNTYLVREDISFEDMVVELPSVDDFSYECEGALWKLLCAETFAQFTNAIADINYMISDVSSASTLANIRYNQHADSAEAINELYQVNEYITLANQMITTRNQYMLDSPVRRIYEYLYGSIEWMKEYNELYSSEMLKLVAEEQDYMYQYQALRGNATVELNGEIHSLNAVVSLMGSDNRETARAAQTAVNDYYDRFRYQYDNILSDLIDVRTRQAQEAGLDSYTELYPNMSSVTYSREETKEFRSYVKQYLVPLMNEIHAEAAAAQGTTNLIYGKHATTLLNYPAPLYDTEGTYDEILSIFDDLSPQTAQYINYMTEHGLIDVFSSSSKSSAAFSTYLPNYSIPFVFANVAGAGDMVETFTHEAGHGLAFFRSYNVMNPSVSNAIAETHSYSTQFLIATQFDRLYENPEDAQDFLLYQSLALLLSSCMLDEYQEILYDNPQMGQTERVAAYASLNKLYGNINIDYSLYPSFGNGKVQLNDNHVFLSPFYAVDYSYALCNAIQLFGQMEEDFVGGFNTYMKLIDLASDPGLAEAAEQVGLLSPFEGETLSALAQLLGKRLLKTS